MDLFYDYRTNVESSPAWQEWLRGHLPPLLVLWGRPDSRRIRQTAKNIPNSCKTVAARGCRGMIGPARWNPGPVVCGPMLHRCGGRRGPRAARRGCGGVGGAAVLGGAAVSGEARGSP
jgi:hypothetical protein